MNLYFTSVSLAEWTLEKKVTIVGKMRLDRKGIPKELKEVKSREEKSVIFMQNDKNNISLVSYFDRKKSGEKNVIVLTTMHGTLKVTNSERKKKQVYVIYGHTKGEVDVVDLLSTNHSTRIK